MIAVVSIVPSVAIHEISTVEMCETLTLTFAGAIVTFVLYVSIYAIFAVEMCATLTFRIGHGEVSKIIWKCDRPCSSSNLIVIINNSLTVC